MKQPRKDGPSRGKPDPKRRDRASQPREPRSDADKAKRPAADDQGAGGERIAKRLARAGVASRRDAEALIAAGRVKVNGAVLASPAFNVSLQDSIEVDGKPIPAIERTRLFLLHKPAGVVTTNRDPEGRRTVFDVLPRDLPRLITVGRLDINTEGLLLLTNDGGLARVLELPQTGWLRRYRVRVHGKVDQAALDGLKEGIAVDGVFYGAIEAVLEREQGSNAWLSIGLREGKNREVRNVLGALGLEVTRLIRVSYGPFQLGELAEGELHEVKGRHLRDQLGERLIGEAGANFEAPLIQRAEAPKKEAPREKAPPAGREAPPNRKRERDRARDDALGRLDTRPDKPRRDGRKDRAAAPERAGKPAEPRRSRSANVWMAPGARPMGEKKKAELAERTEGRRYAGKPRPAGKKRPEGGRPQRPGGPRKPRGPK